MPGALRKPHPAGVSPDTLAHRDANTAYPSPTANVTWRSSRRAHGTGRGDRSCEACVCVCACACVRTLSYRYVCFKDHKAGIRFPTI